MLLAALIALPLVLAVLTLCVRWLLRTLRSLTHRVDVLEGSLLVEVQRIGEIESDLSEHLRDPVKALSKPPALYR